MMWFKKKKSDAPTEGVLDLHKQEQAKALEANRISAERLNTVIAENGFTMEIFASLSGKKTKTRKAHS